MNSGIHTAVGWLLPLVVGVTTSCTADVAPIGSEETVASEEAALTGANPRTDAYFVKTVTPKKAGTSFVDIAVQQTGYYLLRNDGAVEVWRPLVNPTYQSFFTTSFSRIKNVPSGNWGVVAANDVTRKIVKNAQTGVGQPLGSYPSGVNSVGEVAAANAAGGTLQLYIMRGDPNGGPYSVMQPGVYSPATGLISWSSTTYYINPYLDSLAAAGGSVYTRTSYLTSPFHWWNLPNFVRKNEALSPNTEHAYDHPGGFKDRFTPYAMDYYPTDDYFYGLDDCVDTVGTHTQVIARMKKSVLVALP